MVEISFCEVIYQ